MQRHLLAATILLAVSVVVLILGHQIGARGRLSFIAGLEVSMVRDRDGLARWIGRGLVGIGGLDLLISLAMLTDAVSAPLLFGTYLVVSLGGAALLLVRMPRYLR